MITSIPVTSIFVLDQHEALEFYSGTLGLEVSNDINQGGMRWLTVRVPGSNGPDIFLEKPGPPGIDEASAEQVRELVSKGAMGFTVAFSTDDCRGLYETLREKGVEFTQEPVEHFYGIDCGLRDPFGNHIRVVQFAAQPQEATTTATSA